MEADDAVCQARGNIDVHAACPDCSIALCAECMTIRPRCPQHIFVLAEAGLPALRNRTLRIMLAMSPLLPEMLPGDITGDQFDGHLMAVLVCSGMKLRPIQNWMRDNVPSTFDAAAVAAWAAAAYGAAPGLPRAHAMASHGDVSHHTGPIPWLTQLGLVKKSPAATRGPTLWSRSTS